MNTEAEEGFLTRLAERIGSQANARTVFAEPVTSGETTAISVARARWGMGGGGGKGSRAEADHGQGFGGGGGAWVEPVGYLVIRQGEVTYHPIRGSIPTLLAIGLGVLVGSILFRLSAR